MILAQSIRDLLYIITTCTHSLIGVMTLVLLRLCLVKNLTMLASSSLLGIIGMAYTSFAIGIRHFVWSLRRRGVNSSPTLQPKCSPRSVPPGLPEHSPPTPLFSSEC